ncbi:hypothetical protein GCM10025864_34260 [Luteimicrobium album]|uniref:Integral membrane protein n=1 Tax=Luteimicrobium album TaxID=1054550 RepID=A0ABQ6I627_9MICO|nr:hypothetical protein [Luteimicrobium album]GMA25667.1 hypothetical protein GCM10025864_34260 [Luteimicrobium album]
MTVPLTVLVVAASLALAAWAGWFVYRDRPVILRQLWGASVVEALLVVEAVVAGVLLAGSESVSSPGLFWGYVAASLLVLPFAAAVAFAERTRWSSVVLLLAAVTVAFLQLRMTQVWTG